MAAINESMVRQIVAEVVKELQGPVEQAPPAVPPAGCPATPASRRGVPTASGTTYVGRGGIFNDVDEAVEAAGAAQRKLEDLGLEGRRGIIRILRDVTLANLQDLSQREYDETQIGRLDHKPLKLEAVARHTPGVEFLETRAESGDNGMMIEEFAPWGVIGAITPVTHSAPTLLSNSIAMIAAGNAIVFNPHPSGAKIAAYAARLWNEAIRKQYGVDNLISLIETPTLDSANAIFKHRGVAMLCVTGGPGVARAALRATKKAVVAGPGNPPVVVDETADLNAAAGRIVEGAAFDNNLLCTAEKEVFAVESIFEDLLAAVARNGGYRLDARQIEDLTAKAFPVGEGGPMLNKKLVGQSPQFLGRQIGVTVPAGTEILYGRTDESSLFVGHEQMMPFVPFVPVRDFDRGVELALEHEHGYRHTAMLHSKNTDRITKMARAMNVTVFVVNGSSMQVADPLGHGHISYSIATPSGEGFTSPLTFTRRRRLVVIGSMRTI